MPTFNLPVFILGCVGGLLPDALKIIKNRYESTLKKYLKTPQFWVGFLLLVGLGGLIAWLFGATGAKEALLFGYAGPQLLERAVGLFLQQPPDRAEAAERGITLRTWWAG